MEKVMVTSSVEDLYSYLDSLAHTQGTSVGSLIEFFHDNVDTSEELDGEYPALVYAALMLGLDLMVL